MACDARTDPSPSYEPLAKLSIVRDEFGELIDRFCGGVTIGLHFCAQAIFDLVETGLNIGLDPGEIWGTREIGIHRIRRRNHIHGGSLISLRLGNLLRPLRLARCV